LSPRSNPSKTVKTMRVPGLVLMLSVVALGDAGAGEAIQRDQQLAQMDQPKPASSSSGNCMPIGLTARGELVFPWDCREIIERERGPVSIDLSAPPKASAPSLPVASEPARKAAAANDPAPKEQPASQSAEPEHVATIPDTAASPPSASTVAQPADRRLQGKRLTSRRSGDPKTARSPAQPAATPSNRQSRFPVPPPS
jgi:hypothetical protein